MIMRTTRWLDIKSIPIRRTTLNWPWGRSDYTAERLCMSMCTISLSIIGL